MFESCAFLGHFLYLLAKVYCNLDLEENLENLALEIILRGEDPALPIEKNGQGYFKLLSICLFCANKCFPFQPIVFENANGLFVDNEVLVDRTATVVKWW